MIIIMIMIIITILIMITVILIISSEMKDRESQWR